MGTLRTCKSILAPVRKTNLQNLNMFMSVISLTSAILVALIVGADKHLITPSQDDSSNYVTQKDVTHGSEQLFSDTTTSYSVSSSESTGNPFPNSQSVSESTDLPQTSSLSKTNTIKISNSYSSLSNTVEIDSENVATPSDTKLDDWIITNPDSIRSEISSLTTTLPPTTLSIVNPCENDQLVVPDRPVQLHAYTNSTNCSLLVSNENSTAISVTVLKSDINNVYTYFYIEILENTTQICPERYLLVSGSNAPCKVIIPGKQFRFHFQNTEMRLEMHTKEVELSTCYDDTQFTQGEFERCNVTSYENRIKWNQQKQSFEYRKKGYLSEYGYVYRNNYKVTVDVVQYQVKCACDCPNTCMCTLAYREWLSKCIDIKGSNTSKADLIVYNPSVQGLSFANSGIHMIQQHTFLGLEGLKVLILSNNILTTLPPTVCQNLPRLKILKLDNNRLSNLTSDIFKERCEQTLLMLNLSSNELINPPHDLFKTTNKLKTLDLRQSRLIQLFKDSFSSLTVLEILYLGDNELPTLPHDVFSSLRRLYTLDLSGNVISSLPPDVFASLGRLNTLDLSGNVISSLPPDVFASLGLLLILDLSGNLISSLPHDVFASLGLLHTLDLSGNVISSLPHDVFASLGRLHSLDLSGNLISSLPHDVFASLGWLFTLDLSGNVISSLPHDVFASLGLLRTLDLSGNVISSLPHDVFASLGELSTLDLSGNLISSLPHDVFASLDYWLLTLDLSGNVISSLPHDVFASLGRLHSLDLSGNVISSLPHDVFASLGRLHSLDLSGNLISSLPHDVFASLDYWLLTLDLSGNLISSLPHDVFASLGRLHSLDLSGNLISSLPHDVFASLGRLSTLDLSGNVISSLPPDVFASLGNMKSLNISHNNISHNLSNRTFQSLSNLITLDLSHNAISALPHDIFKSQRNLLILDVSQNNIFVMPGEVFEKLANLKVLKLDGNNLTVNSSQEIFDSLSELKVLSVSKNSIKRFPLYIFRFTENLRSLDVSHNALISIPDQCFANLSNLINLNMSRNFLSRMPSFKAQGQLQVLDLSENRLRALAHGAFNENHNLKFLSLSKNNLLTISSQMFNHLHNLTFINISYNVITKIGSKVFSDRINYQSVDARGNEMHEVTSYSFKGARNTAIIVDKYATCCFIHKDQCVSVEPRSEYLTCSRMLQNVFLRISVWILGISAFTCNIIAYCVRSRKKQGNKVQTLLISHLALSDLLMGVNMLLLAIGDLYYGEYFPSYSHSWRHGFACKLAGFLSIMSSEGSVFFITLISIDRLLGIKYPFGDHMLSTKLARLCVLLAWLAAFLIGAIPIGLASNRADVFSISEVCIGIPIVRRNLRTLLNNSVSINISLVSSSLVYQTRSYFPVWEYSYVKGVNVEQQEFIQNIPYTVAHNAGSQIASIYSIVVFICVNLVCFFTVAFCYTYLFIIAKTSSETATRPQDQKDEVRMAKKLFAIVFTDFCCWVPLSFMCILAQCGVLEISPEMYAWTVGFILPINSSINPFLYVLYETISNHLNKKKKERKEKEIREMKARWKPLILFGTRFDQKKNIHETTF